MKNIITFFFITCIFTAFGQTPQIRRSVDGNQVSGPTTDNGQFTLTNAANVFGGDGSRLTGVTASGGGTTNLSLMVGTLPSYTNLPAGTLTNANNFQTITNPSISIVSSSSAVHGITNTLSTGGNTTTYLGGAANINDVQYSTGLEALILYGTPNGNGSFLNFNRFGQVLLVATNGAGLTIDAAGELAGNGDNITNVTAVNVVGIPPATTNAPTIYNPTVIGGNVVTTNNIAGSLGGFVNTNRYNFSGFSLIPINGLNGLTPIISTNNFAPFDLAEARDPVCWYARGKIWIAYTGVTNVNYAIYSSSVLLASSTNGYNWTLYGVIASGNGNPASYRGGCLAPSGVVYEATNDTLHMWGLSTPTENAVGTNYIYGMNWISNADWTISNNFTWNNNDSPVLQYQGNGYESNSSDITGPYSPWVGYASTNWLMLYSSHCGSNGVYYANAAYPTNGLDSGFMRSPLNPIYGNQYQPAEEPSAIKLNDGSLVSLSDALDLAWDGYWRTTDTNGMSGWFYCGDAIVYPKPSNFFFSAPSWCQLPDGRLFYVAAGYYTGAGRNLYGFFGLLNWQNQNIDATFVHATQINVGPQTYGNVPFDQSGQSAGSILFSNKNGLTPTVITEQDAAFGDTTYASQISLGSPVDPNKTIGIAIYSGSGELTLNGYSSVGIYIDHNAMNRMNINAKTRIGGFAPSVFTYPSMAGTMSNTLALTQITFPATTVNWTNTTTSDIVLFINNAGVTGTSMSINGTQIASTLLVTGAVPIFLQPGEYFSETYTVGTPVGKYKPFP